MRTNLQSCSRDRLSGSLAFTLTEALVAMAVAGVMFVALYSGMATTTFSVRLARENLRATQIMVEKMEVIRLLTWNQITTANIIPPQFTAPYYSATGASNDVGGLTYYGKVWILSPTSTQLGGVGYNNDLRAVAVQLVWTNRGLPHKRQLISYVSRYGIQNYEIN